MSAESALRPPPSVLKVLYAEDNPQDADQTRTHFAEAAPDFHIEIAGTGQACLDRLRETGFDLLLLDHRLPDMDGLDVLKALVRDGTPVPAVLVTGLGDEKLVVKALRLGAADYVPKRAGYLAGLPPILRRVAAAERERRRLGLPPAHSPRQVLYVEDNAMDADLTLNFFREAMPHVKVQVARSCLEALKIVKRRADLDLVVLDLFFDGMSGLELLRQFNQDGRQSPVVVVTSLGSEDTALAALRLGAEAYVPKRENYLPHLASILEPVILRFQLDRIKEQERAKLARRVLALEDLLPICASCKQIRLTGEAPDDPKSWISIESHLAEITGATLTHGLCPDCVKKVYGEDL